MHFDDIIMACYPRARELHEKKKKNTNHGDGTHTHVVSPIPGVVGYIAGGCLSLCVHMLLPPLLHVKSEQ